MGSQRLEWLHTVLDSIAGWHEGDKVSKMTYTDKSTLWVCAPIRRLRVDVRLKVMDRLDFLEFGHWTATGSGVLLLLWLTSTRDRGRTRRSTIIAKRSTQLRTSRQGVVLFRAHFRRQQRGKPRGTRGSCCRKKESRISTGQQDDGDFRDGSRSTHMEATDRTEAVTCNWSLLSATVERCCLGRAGKHRNCETCPG